MSRSSAVASELPDASRVPHRFAETRADHRRARHLRGIGPRAFVKHLAETMNIGPIRDFHRELRARRAAGTKFPVPLLLLYAERDPMVPPRFGDVFAALVPDARLVRLAEASHFAHVDAPDRFLPPVLDFLS